MLYLLILLIAGISTLTHAMQLHDAAKSVDQSKESSEFALEDEEFMRKLDQVIATNDALFERTKQHLNVALGRKKAAQPKKSDSQNQLAAH